MTRRASFERNRTSARRDGYVLGLRESPTRTLALGTAFHSSALASDFSQKIETKQNLRVEELEESFDEAFAIAAEDVELRP